MADPGQKADDDDPEPPLTPTTRPIGSRGGAVAVATMTACDADGQSVLHLAARAGAVDAVAAVLRRLEAASSAQQEGEDALRRALDLVDRWERTPLHWALLNGHLEAGALQL